VYAPFKTGTDQRVADAKELNTTASEYPLLLPGLLLPLQL
jgi:hypothetical protein